MSGYVDTDIRMIAPGCATSVSLPSAPSALYYTWYHVPGNNYLVYTRYVVTVCAYSYGFPKVSHLRLLAMCSLDLGCKKNIITLAIYTTILLCI